MPRMPPTSTSYFFAVGVEQPGIELANQLAGLDVPMLDAALEIGGDQTLAVGVKGDVIHMAFVPEQFAMQLSPRLGSPDAHRTIVPGGGD